MKTITICTIFILYFTSLHAQTVKSVEATSTASSLKVLVNTSIVGKDIDATGPSLVIDLPTDYQEFYINYTEGSKGLKASVKVEFAGTVNDASGVKSVTVNGTMATLTETTTYDTEFEVTINLAEGEHLIEIQATDINNNASSIKRNVTVKPNVVALNADYKKRNLYVLSIGISSFQNSDDVIFSDLSYADADATSIQTLFKSQEGVLYNKVFTKLLVNDKATRLEIIDGLTWLEDNPSSGDVVVLFISSHGFNEADKTYIMPYDGNVTKLRATALDFYDIDQTIEKLSDPLQRNCRVLTLIDACHSGGIGTQGSKGASALSIETALKTLDRKEAGVLGIYSSEGSEKSYEDKKWLHGAFTYAILQSLQNGDGDVNEDDVINFDELSLYLKENVKKLTEYKQHPVVKNSASITEFPVTVILK